MLCRSFFVLAFWFGLAACAPPRTAPAGPDDEPTGGMLTPEEEAAFAAHVRVLSKEELAAEQNEKVFRFTKYLVDNATPGCQEELNDVFALTNSTEDRAIPPDSLFSEECELEFAFVRGSNCRDAGFFFSAHPQLNSPHTLLCEITAPTAKGGIQRN